MSLLFSRFGLSNKFDTEFPSVLTGKVSVRLNCSFKWKDAVPPVVSVLHIHAPEPRQNWWQASTVLRTVKFNFVLYGIAGQ